MLLRFTQRQIRRDVFADDELCVATVVDPRPAASAFDGDGWLERANQLTLQYYRTFYATQWPIQMWRLAIPPAQASAAATQIQSHLCMC